MNLSKAAGSVYGELVRLRDGIATVIAVGLLLTGMFFVMCGLALGSLLDDPKPGAPR